MQSQDAHIVVSFQKRPAQSGLIWILQAWQLFRANPAGIHLAVFGYFITLVLSSFLPIVGVLLPVLLLPLLSVGVMNVMRASLQPDQATRGNSQLLQYMTEPFKEPHVRNRLMIFGLLYGLCNLGVIGLVSWFDNGNSMFEFVLESSKTTRTPEMQNQIMTNLGIMMVLMSIVSLLFWFVPVLIAWHKQSIAKAIFFSLMGAFRNISAFIVFGLLCASALVLTFFGLGALTQLLGIKTLGAFVAMLLVPMFMVLMFCTFYTTYADLIIIRDLDQQEPSQGNAPPTVEP